MGPTKPKTMRFTSKQIEGSLGLRLNTLHNYCKAGAITPEIDEGKGTGHQRVFSATNYIEAVLIKQLMNLGIPQTNIVRMLKSIADASDRSRLDPQRFLDRKDNSPSTYLIFTTPTNKQPLCHRFIVDDPLNGSILRRKDIKEGKVKLWGKTQGDSAERLSDFLGLTPMLLVFDLDQIIGYWLFGQLARMANDGSWTE